MTNIEQKNAAKEFSEYWKDKGYEKGESQRFWLSLLGDVLGVEHPARFIRFEDRVVLDHTSFIDGIIPSTHVLIEQKSSDKDLRKAIKQADGRSLTPFQQAKRYSSELPYSERPRWIVTCNFQEFLIYNMEKPNDEPIGILLKDLPKEYYRLKFLVDADNNNVKREMEISIKAGDLVGVLYDEILKQYKDPTNPESLKSLNMLCVRLVFCLYAEDAGIFGSHTKFHDYIQSFAVKDVRRALIDLFKVLDTPAEKRDPYLDEMLSSFPYVNGGLFQDEQIEIPQFNDRIVNLILQNASEDFDWSEISPTIFGAVFESTLNPETRRSGGMHYTSIENIHKVIDPLFLDELTNEFNSICEIKIDKTKNVKLEEYRDKLASLTFLDPACGSGNFLTETYISLRRLENKALEIINKGQIKFDFANPIKVNIRQFYGIEINDFAVTVAKTALWIAESRMMRETEEIVKQSIDFLPLKSYANIVEANSLRIDWQTVAPKAKLNYIMGNPPFVGARLMNTEQKADLSEVFGAKWKNSGNLDYVSCWYKKIADFIFDTDIRCALVSTNSISQGESVANLWKPLFANGIHIDFAYRTFRWDSEANLKAHVHCVIIGFSAAPSIAPKKIYTADEIEVARNINGYLINGENIFIENRSKPLCDVPILNYGSFALDDGNYTIERDEYEEIISKDKNAAKYFKPFIGARELLHGVKRYCVWLKNVSPAEIKSCDIIYEKVLKVREWRRSSTRKNTVALADTPTLFAEIRQPDSRYLAIPTVCSEKRRYLPIAYLSPDVIASNQLYILPNATVYHFGVLTSIIHNAWMRAVCGRLKSDYRYSNNIVYNNFPWCEPSAEHRAKIEQTAQAVLDARSLYPDCSLADLYDEVAMPPELRKAHQQNDKAVMQAYGFSVKMTESECVAALMEMYKKLADQNR